jgi:hypothetical protein
MPMAQKQMESTARSRELGEALRQHRERADLLGYELAKALGWHPTKVSRIEGGGQWATEIDVAMVLAYCRAKSEEYSRLRKMFRGDDDGHWLQPHGTRAPDELVTLVRHETTAGLIRCFEPLVVPGLLQTEEYARGVFRDTRLAEEIVETRTRIRMERQVVLRREIPPQTLFFVHEQVLHSAPASNPGVLGEQLLAMTLASARSECTIRVIPRSACAQGAFGGSFRLMEFADHRPVGYVEHQTASVFLEERDEVGRYRDILKTLAELALDGGESRELLASLASFYG